MFNKYSNVLTMILIVIIVLIVGILGYIGYDTYVKEKTEDKAQLAIEEFERATKSVKKNIKATNTVKNETAENTATSVNPSDIMNQLGGETNTNQQQVNETPTEEPEKTYLEGYEILGTINIPKTGAHYPILSEVTKRSIEIAVGVLYPPNTPALNQVGNVVIAGHNYRNGKFFSNNKKLSNGDTIEIQDATGTTVTYEIYNIYETSTTDAEYMKRDTNGTREISLSTCTDDSSARLVIWAREI